MTAQAGDRITIDGEAWTLMATPLVDELQRRGWGTVMTSTGNWRGHVATWRLDEGRLWLVAADGKVEAPAGPDEAEQTEVRATDGDAAQTGGAVPWPQRRAVVDLRLEEVFGKAPPIEATWCTGRLRVVRGPATRYVHMGYESEFEHEGWITVAAGYVTEIDLLAGERRRQRQERLEAASKQPPWWKFWAERPPRPWTCEHGHLNEASDRVCLMCGSRRPTG